MHISHLSLSNFRNFTRLGLALPAGATVLQGNNAQGKSNFLEAIYLLATTRSPRASSERELIHWLAWSEELPTCRLVADVHRAAGSLRLEVALGGRGGDAGEPPQGPVALQKRVRVNGVARRAADFIGQLNVVLFSALDIALVGGEPALRRRYLDITNSQVDRNYLRSLQHYNRVLLQRNHLLRSIGEGGARADELAFWDGELIAAGSYLIAQRQSMVAAVNELVETIHGELSGGEERLKLAYWRSIDRQGQGGGEGETAETFARALEAVRGKEIAQGMSLVGPHRDELRFLVHGIDMGTYGSRGQQRTIALSLRLAEARFMAARSGETPVLLLDDVLSELDRDRRDHLINAATGYEQVITTTTDLDRFPPSFLEQAALLQVSMGQITPIARV